MLFQVHSERVETDRVAGDEFGVVKALADNDVHHAERERGVGARTNHQGLIGLHRRFGLPHVNRDDVGAAAPRRDEVARRVRLAREVGAPQENQRRVRAHVLLGVGLEDAGESKAESAEAPTDHRRVPPLTAVEIREAAHQMRSDARAIVAGEEPVPYPGADGLAPRRTHPRGDEIQRLVPRGAAHRGAAPLAYERRQQPARVADDLVRGLTANTQKAAAIRIVGVAADADEAPVLDLGQHPAQGGEAIHRAHRADRTDLGAHAAMISRAGAIA